MGATNKLLGGVAVSIMLLSAWPGMAQSLGDVARKQRQNQQSTPSAKARKVVTDDDIPQRAESSSASKPATEESPSPPSPPPAARKRGTAEQWKAMIEAQKEVIAKLQARVDAIRPTIRFVDPQAYWDGPQYNQ